MFAARLFPSPFSQLHLLFHSLPFPKSILPTSTPMFAARLSPSPFSKLHLLFHSPPFPKSILPTSPPTFAARLSPIPFSQLHLLFHSPPFPKSILPTSPPMFAARLPKSILPTSPPISQPAFPQVCSSSFTSYLHSPPLPKSVLSPPIFTARLSPSLFFQLHLLSLQLAFAEVRSSILASFEVDLCLSDFGCNRSLKASNHDAWTTCRITKNWFQMDCGISASGTKVHLWGIGCNRSLKQTNTMPKLQDKSHTRIWQSPVKIWKSTWDIEAFIPSLFKTVWTLLHPKVFEHFFPKTLTPSSLVFEHSFRTLHPNDFEPFISSLFNNVFEPFSMPK